MASLGANFVKNGLLFNPTSCHAGSSRNFFIFKQQIKLLTGCDIEKFCGHFCLDKQSNFVVAFKISSDEQQPQPITTYPPTHRGILPVVTRLGDLLDFWATFQSLWQQLISPNLSHSQAIFVKMSKSLISLVKSFLATFIDIW